MTECKDCIHYEVCAIEVVINTAINGNCKFFKDKSKIIKLPTKFKLNSVVYVSPNNGKSFYRGFFCGVSLNNENKTTHIVCISDRVNFKNEKIKLNPIRHFYDYFLKLYSEEGVKQALRVENNEISTIKH